MVGKWLEIHPRGAALSQGLAAVLQDATPAARPGTAAVTYPPPSAMANSASAARSTSTSDVLRIIHRIVTLNSRAAEALLPPLLASTLAAAESPAVPLGKANPRLVAAMDQASALAKMMEAVGLSPYDEAVDRAFGEGEGGAQVAYGDAAAAA
jgi:hypothetical protein